MNHRKEETGHLASWRGRAGRGPASESREKGREPSMAEWSVGLRAEGRGCGREQGSSGAGQKGSRAEGRPASREDYGEAEEDAPSLPGATHSRADAQAGLPPGSTHEAEVAVPGRGVPRSWGHKARLLEVTLGLLPLGEPSACPQAGLMLGPPPGTQTVPPWRPRSPSSWNSAAHSTDAQK